MMKRRIKHINLYLLLFLALTATRCSNKIDKHNLTNSYKLAITDKEIRVPIDNTTYPENGRSYSFLSKDGTEYLVCQNKNLNEIHFYNLAKQKLEFKILLDVKGPGGIKTTLRGFWVNGIDDIFLTPAHQYKLYRINRKGEIKSIIDYYNADENAKPYLNRLMSSYSLPTHHLIIEHDNIYVTMLPNGNWSTIKENDLDKIPLSISIDTTSNAVKILPVYYPKSSYKYNNWLYSWTYGNKTFVYSFNSDNNILVTKDFKNFNKIDVKSRFFTNIKKMSRGGSVSDLFKYRVLYPEYFRIMYDKYRKVYYRFAYPGYQLKKDDNIRTLYEYKPVFSIIILDKNLNKIGETLFPEKTFNVKDIIILKDGLYISENHPENPNYNPDFFSFRLLKLVKNDK